MIPDELIDALNATVFWRRLMADPELQVAISDAGVTVLLGRRELLGQFRMIDGQLTCQSPRQTLPGRTYSHHFENDCRPKVEHRVDSNGHLRLHPLPEPVELLDASEERLDAYKLVLRGDSLAGERHRLLIRFGADPANDIVACFCSSMFGSTYDYVVLRGDDRVATPVELRSMREYGGVTPRQVEHAISRLRQVWGREPRHTSDGINETLTLRRRLGAARLLQDTDERVVRLAERPVIAIGDCSEAEIAMISERRGEWAMLTERGLDERCEVIPFWRRLRL